MLAWCVVIVCLSACPIICRNTSQYCIKMAKHNHINSTIW